MGQNAHTALFRVIYIYLDSVSVYLMGQFGVPFSVSKTECPCTGLSFLGIDIDSENMV